MNKTVRLLIALLLFSGASFGQNLVPNPSFEVFTTCPTFENQLSYAGPWFSPSVYGTPDYFNACSTSPPFSVPHNATGYQPAFNGQGYAGIYMWSAVIAPNVREYIEAPLTSPLTAGQCYHFTMRVNLSNTSAYATRSIGAYLSDTLMKGFSNFPLPVLPQITDPTGARFDTTSWTLVSGDYKAHGEERYIVIGNFKSDAATDTVANSQNPGGQGFIYVLIDSISLVKQNCNLSVPQVAAGQIAVAPNPFTDRLLIRMEEAGDYEIAITGGDARVLFRAAFGGSLEINTAAFPQGLYFYEIRSKRGDVRRGKILKM